MMKILRQYLKKLIPSYLHVLLSFLRRTPKNYYCLLVDLFHCQQIMIFPFVTLAFQPNVGVSGWRFLPEPCFARFESLNFAPLSPWRSHSAQRGVGLFLHFLRHPNYIYRRFLSYSILPYCFWGCP